MAAEHVGSTDFDKRTSVDIKLHFPVTVNAEKIDTLTMRRPRNKDAITAQGFKSMSDVKRGMAYFALLCDVSPDVIEELDEVDANQLGEQLKAFTGRQAA